MTRVAVVGRGSAAARTLRVLEDMGISDVVNVATQPVEGFEHRHLLSIDRLKPDRVDWVFDCSPASRRVTHARLLSERGLPTVFEKPLSMTSDSGKLVLDFYSNQGVPVKVAYNLRNFQAFEFVRGLLAESALGPMIRAEISVGQYLPDWRPMRDYRSTVSAQESLGGGVLLELSHEINYAIGLWGRVRTVAGKTKNSRELDIDAEDWAEGTLMFDSHPNSVEVSVTLDFLRRTPERWCRITGQVGGLRWDLLRNEVSVATPTGDVLHHFDDTFEDTYRQGILEMMAVVSCESGQVAGGNADALHTLEVIDAWRSSSQNDCGVDVRMASVRA